MGENNVIKDKTGRNQRLKPENGQDKQKERLQNSTNSFLFFIQPCFYCI